MKHILPIISILLLFSSPQLFAQWSSSPNDNKAVATLSGQQAIPKVSTQTNGDTYISWFSPENGNYNVRMQRYDVFGHREWESGGLLISDNESMGWITDYSMIAGYDNRIYIAFQDIRNGSNNAYIYKISPSGQFDWGEDGIQLSDDEDFTADPKIAFTDQGNIVTGWISSGEESVIVLQKLNPDGALQWGDGVVLQDNTGMEYNNIWLVPASNDAVFAVYTAYTPPNSQNVMIYIQKYDAEGNAVWDNHVAVLNTSVFKSYHELQTATGPDGGAFIAWMDARAGSTFQSFVQYIDGEGNQKYEQNGLEISVLSTYMLTYPFIAWDDENDALYAFTTSSSYSQNYKGIAGQKIAFESGERLWGTQGIEFYMLEEASKQLAQVRLTEDGNVIAICTDQPDYPATNESIFAFAVDTEGSFAWTSERIDMSSANSNKIDVVAGMAQDYQIVAAWADDRNDEGDIYAQNVQFNGELGPITDLEVNATADPQTICSGGSSQLTALATGGTGAYSWSWTSEPAGFTSNEQNPQVQPTENTTYFVDCNDGEDIRSASVSVEVDGIPPATGDISGDSDVCRGGGNKVYSVEPVQYATEYQWTLPAGFEFASASTTTPTITVIVNDNAESGQISVVPANDCGAGDGSLMDIVVHELPVINAGTDSEICFGECDTLTATGGVNYSWNTGAFVASIIVCPETTSEYIVTGRDEMGCANKDTVWVYVHALPEMPEITGPTEVLNDQPYDYSVIFHEGSEWTWSAENGTVVSGQGTNEAGFEWENPGTDRIFCYETSEFGCNSDTANLDVLIGGVGIDFIRSDIQVYPNPFENEIFIEIPTLKTKAENILLTDLTGKQWPVEMSAVGERIRLELVEKTMPSGLYFVQIDFGEGKRICLKLVRE